MIGSFCLIVILVRRLIFIELRKIFQSKILESNDESRILLGTLALYFEPNFPVKKLQPEKWEFEAPLKWIVELINKYSLSILKGELWISESKALNELHNRKKVS